MAVKKRVKTEFSTRRNAMSCASYSGNTLSLSRSAATKAFLRSYRLTCATHARHLRDYGVGVDKGLLINTSYPFVSSSQREPLRYHLRT